MLLEHFRKLVDAWTGSRDVDGVLACMTDDVVWYPAVGVMPPVIGKDAVRETLQTLSKQISGSDWRIVRHAEAGNVLFLEGVDANTLTSGVRAEVPYAGVVEFEGDRIRAWRDYLDGGLFGRAMAGKGAPEHVRPLIEAAR